MESTRGTYMNNGKRVYYLSLEFLIGRLLRDAMSNLGLMDDIREALSSLSVEFDVIAGLEPDAALGNGGLGRLAACFMESMATVNIPAYGYGIRYVHGLFRQQMADGWQVELRKAGSPTAIHGNSNAAKAPTKSASAARSRRSMPRMANCVTSGSRASVSLPPPMTRRLSAGVANASTPCACGRPSQSTRSCSMPSMPATTSARCARATRRNR